MISANDLVNTCLICIREKWGYIWGKNGQLWTAEAQRSATRDTTKKYGSKWIGHRVCDCSGLLNWAMGLYGIYIYHGSDTIFREYCTIKGKLKKGQRDDGKPIRAGTAVFLYDKSKNNRHHVGVYLGNGQCVEEKGTMYGPVYSPLSHWDEWAELKNVDYDSEVVIDMDSLRPGEKSDRVKQLQTDLTSLGYDPGKIDSIYGKQTKAAVEAFQRDHGLSVDGIAGDKTLAALDEALHRDPPSPGPVDPDIDKLVKAAEDSLHTAQYALNEALGFLERIREGGNLE